VFPGCRREGERVARTSRRWESGQHGRRGGVVACARRATQPSRQDARRAVGALERDLPVFSWSTLL
jgi:hypothetical protein